MKKIYLSVILGLLYGVNGYGQTAVDAAVQITASVQVSPPSITLNWITTPTATQYTIFRKLKTATLWGSPVATLSGTITSYVDNTVTAGISYEYKISRSAAPTYAVPIYGFINTGIEVPAIENRGNLILVVDSAFITSLSSGILRLQNDLEGDGWKVVRLNVLRTSSVTNVKAKIVTAYNLDPLNTKALFILGHVPVPYSGNINPDGHPDHLGAWPTDTYYADINGNWTDVGPATTTASPARTQNLPGDGKFDQSIIPSTLELQTGRVDLYNLTSFTLTETQLMQNYLNKDHDYRNKIFTVQKRAVVDDNFGYMNGEAFAASGYNNFGPLVGSVNITAADYFTVMTGTNNSYLWSYGCGGGSFNSAGGIGTTSNFATSNLQGIFTMLFGSYFGDWDVQNSFLRAPLAQGTMLTNSWSGRPHHQYHHMAMGENIGYSMWVTQNYQSSLYYPNIYGINGGWVHNGLMGDPTLRNDVVGPVSSVVATVNGNNCNITWAASTETNIVGYNIYMKNDTNTAYVKINPAPINITSYIDNCLLYPGIYKYMVRALKLENTPSGTYYNLSEGVADTAFNSSNLIVNAQFTNVINSNTVVFNNASINANSYSWTLGNGATSTATNPSVTYTANGSYTVTLIALNNCDADSITQVINIIGVGFNEISLANNSFNFYPNPANTNITISNDGCENCSIIIFNNEGKQVYFKSNVNDKLKINVSDFKKGLYLIKLIDKENRTISKKIIID